MNRDKLVDDLKIEEGRKVAAGKHYAYRDHLAYWTIGYGRLIDRSKGGGLTEAEALYLLNNDITRIEEALGRRWPGFKKLDEVRRRAIIMMAFQLGDDGLLKFKNMIAAIDRGDFRTAAAEALNSKWAKVDTPARAQRMAYMIQTGLDPQKEGKRK